MNAELFDGDAFLEPADIPAGLVAPASLATFYAASQAFTSTPADTPANQYFEPRIINGFTFKQTLLGSSGWPAGSSAIAWGDLTLANGDDFYDGLVDGYAIDGRQLVVKLGDPAGAYADFNRVLVGTSAGWRVGLNSVRLSVNDPMQRINVAVQQALYGGAGGADGGADLQGLPKPLSFGYCRNVPAVLIDAANQVYQVHSRAVKSLAVVRDRGAVIVDSGDFASYAALAAAGLAVGHYGTCLAQGLFRLGYTPATTQNVTADVEGDAQGGYASDTAGVLRRVLKDFVGLSDSDLDGASFDQLAYERPGLIGLFVGATPTNATDLADQLVGGVMGWIGGNRAGKLSVGALLAPISTPAFDLAEADVILIERLEPPAFLYPPPRRLRVAYAHAWAPVSTDIAGSVSAADRAFLLASDRYAASFSSAVAAAYALAQDPTPIAGLYAEVSDAQALADFLVNEAVTPAPLFGPTRKLFRVTTDRYLGQVELGMTGRVAHTDYNLDQGFSGVVVEWTEDQSSGQLQVVLFG
jgi:hypothetical protein